MTTKLTLTAAAGAAILTTLTLQGVRVTDVDGLYAAADAVTKGGANAPREIVIADGEYLLSRTVVMKCEAVTGLVIRAEHPGKARLLGGVPLTGWTKEADGSYVASVPGAKDGAFFRTLVKNDEWVPMSVVPGGTNRFEHLSRFDAALLSNLAGHWSRKPTDDEQHVMRYKASDLPDAMDLENADVRFFHMWDDTLCTVSNVDRKAHALRVVQQTNWPMGAQGKFEYEVLNVREGMTPGKWYLDRRAAKVHYRPLPGEDMAKLRFLIPVIPTVLDVTGCREARVEGLVVGVTTPTLRNRPGFGGCGLPPAFNLSDAQGLTVRGLTVRNAGGVGLNVSARRLKMTDSVISFTGGCAMNGSEADALFERCRIADAGQVFRGSSGLFVSGSRITLKENEICRAPYSGAIVFGNGNRLLTNYIHHVMQVLHDGAAVYGLYRHGLMSGNVVRDVEALGEGFGVHAYYADEGSRNTVIEGNYAEGMPVPIHNHMSEGIVVRGNTLVNHNGDIRLSFQRSIRGTFEDNLVIADGKLGTVGLDGIDVWRNNRAFTRPSTHSTEPATVAEWNPPRPPQDPREPLAVPRAAKAPAIDGEFADYEWPGDLNPLERDATSHESGWSSDFVRFMWDERNLYCSFLTANFGDSPISYGSRWLRDDGIELQLGSGRRIRAFNDGTVQTEPAALGKASRIVALKNRKGNPNLLRVEMAIPWSALGMRPAAGAKLGFNALAYVSEFGQLKTWDGTDRRPELVLSAR